MEREAEPRRTSQPYLDLFDSVVDRCRPRDEALVDWFENYARQHRGRLAYDLQLLDRFTQPDAEVLEYGAVPLLLTAAAARMDRRVRAVDLAPERFAEAIRELELDVVRCDCEREAVPFEANTFDAVLFNEIFEHLRIDPIFTLREALRVLKPGGVLMLSTPNLRSLRGLRNLVLHNQAHAASADVFRQYQKLSQLGHMGHVREYTTREVGDFLSQVGFRPQRLIFRGGVGSGPVGILERLAPSMRPFFTLVASK